MEIDFWLDMSHRKRAAIRAYLANFPNNFHDIFSMERACRAKFRLTASQYAWIIRHPSNGAEGLPPRKWKLKFSPTSEFTRTDMYGNIRRKSFDPEDPLWEGLMSLFSKPYFKLEFAEKSDLYFEGFQDTGFEIDSRQLQYFLHEGADLVQEFQVCRINREWVSIPSVIRASWGVKPRRYAYILSQIKTEVVEMDEKCISQLRAEGFKVVQQKLANFNSLRLRQHTNDIVFIFISSHGHVAQSTLYISDFKENGKKENVPLSRVYTQLARNQALSCIVTNACRVTADEKSTGKIETQFPGCPNSVILVYATREGTFSIADIEPFVRELVRGAVHQEDVRDIALKMGSLKFAGVAADAERMPGGGLKHSKNQSAPTNHTPQVVFHGDQQQKIKLLNQKYFDKKVGDDSSDEDEGDEGDDSEGSEFTAEDGEEGDE